MRARLPEAYDELFRAQDLLEKHYHDMQDIEFTVQEGRFYILQTRSGKRTGRASVRIAVEMVREGMIDEKEALLRVSPEHVQSFLHPMVDPQAKREVIASGCRRVLAVRPASPCSPPTRRWKSRPTASGLSSFVARRRRKIFMACALPKAY
jgi:phosphoenolpyruvate synthase/pyruvate phosphate dikinase